MKICTSWQLAKEFGALCEEFLHRLDEPGAWEMIFWVDPQVSRRIVIVSVTRHARDPGRVDEKGIALPCFRFQEMCSRVVAGWVVEELRKMPWTRAGLFSAPAYRIIDFPMIESVS